MEGGGRRDGKGQIYYLDAQERLVVRTALEAMVQAYGDDMMVSRIVRRLIERFNRRGLDGMLDDLRE